MDRCLLRVDEAAQILGIGRSKMYELVSTGEVQCLRFGKSVRIPVHVLDELIGAPAPVVDPVEQPVKEAPPKGSERRPLVWLESDRLVIDIAGLLEILLTYAHLKSPSKYSFKLQR